MRGTQDVGFGVSGCRLSDGMLHLGHYVGCFHPRKLSQVSTNFFVIQDQELHTLGKELDSGEAFDVILSQLYAIPGAEKIIPCSQSRLFPVYSPLYDFARSSMTLRKLRTVHPKKDDIEDGFSISLRDFLFPVDEAVQFLGLRATYVLMNDDNLRFVNLAKFLWKKTPEHVRCAIREPQIILAPVSRLLGNDGRKMAKSNSNAIFFFDDDAIVSQKVRKYAKGLGWRQLHTGGWARSGDRVPDAERALSNLLAAFEVVCQGQALTDDIPAVIEAAVARVVALVRDVRTKAQMLLTNRAALRERFFDDQSRAEECVRQTVAALRA